MKILTWMRRALFGMALSVFLAIAISASADPRPPADPRLSALLERRAAVRTVSAKVVHERPADASRTGRIAVPVIGTIVLEIPATGGGPRKRITLREELSTDAEVVDGTWAWTWRFEKDVRKEKVSDAGSVLRDTPLYPFNLRGAKVVGECDVVDGAIEVSSGWGGAEDLCLDPQGLVLRIRRYHSGGRDEPRGKMWQEIRFEEMRVNDPVPPSTFSYTPVPGAKVSEFVGGQTRETMVPLRTVTSEEASRANEALARVDAAFAKVQAFRAEYQDSVTPDHGIIVDGITHRPEVRRRGTLLSKPTGEYRIEYTEHRIPAGTSRRKIAMTDLSTEWNTDGRTKHKSKDLVHVSSRSVFPSLFSLIEALAIRIHGEKQPRVEALESEYEVFAPPRWIVRPLGNFDRGSVNFEGTDTLDGVSVLHFVVHESARQRRSMHWIGAEDGIPRKVIITDWASARDAAVFELSNVAVNPAIDAKSFVFENDGTWVMIEGSRFASAFGKTPPELDIEPAMVKLTIPVVPVVTSIPGALQRLSRMPEWDVRPEEDLLKPARWIATRRR